MKKVLIISYYFPPSGGPGVQRVLKMVKYLPQFGWEPVVLTVEEGDYPARDESLLEEIPEGTRVYRTKIFEPYRLYRRLTGKRADSPVDVENIPRSGGGRSVAERLAGFIRETFFIPDARIGWFPYAYPYAKEIATTEGIEAIYSSSPPYTTAVIARELHNKTGIPWVAGFRDPWVGFISSPERWSFPRAVDSFLERSVYEDADLVECAWAGIMTDFQTKYPHVNPLKCIHLPNGFDSQDYPAVAPAENDRFTVVYTGSMYGRRTPQNFLAAVEALAAAGRVDPSRIRFRFIGRFGAEVVRMLERSTLHGSVEIVSYLPHRESILELMKADALLLVVDEAKESAQIVPGKVFEYVGARKPIIAIAPPGAVSALIGETRSGFVADRNDRAAIQRAFVECYENYLYHKQPFQPNLEAMKKYERRETSRRLAELLDYLRTHRASPRQ